MKKKFLDIFTLKDFWTEAPPYAAFFRRLPVLETPDLILRPFQMRDAEDLYSWCSDPEVARYVLWDPYRSPADARDYLRAMLRRYRQGAPGSWAMEDRHSGHVIGSIGVMGINVEYKSAEIGYSMSRAYWNRGLMTQALSAVLRTLFETLGLHRVEGQCDIRNPASGRVMEKSGMIREGVLRDRIYNKGEYVDTVLYAAVQGR